MKKILTSVAITLGLTALMVVARSHDTMSTVDYFNEANIIRCTAYGDDELANGDTPHYGIIAAKGEWLREDYTVMLWEVREDGKKGDFIGFFEIKDTGYGIKGSILNGTSIDVWVDYYESEKVDEWVKEHGDYVYMLIIPGCIG